MQDRRPTRSLVPPAGAFGVAVAGIALLLSAQSAVSAIDIQREIIAPAQSFLGSGYCRGGTTAPCFDCSGFVSAIYRPFIPDLPRISRDMARTGEAVSRSDLSPGDLVFFATGGRVDTVNHVAIYIGQDSIIHAISDGPNRGVAITPLSAQYWRTRFRSARRVLPTRTVAQADYTEGMRFSNGLYRGALSDGEPSGEGTMEMDNGDRYDGTFESGVFHGKGTYRWANGDVYEGSFRDGTLDGFGVLTAVSGDRIAGRWSDGELITPTSDAFESDAASRGAIRSRQTYSETARSPWDTWDGIVGGDYYAWLEAENQAFNDAKAENDGWRR